jgi:AcrR family transcriptional regulator
LENTAVKRARPGREKGRQAIKSENTRKAILEATVQCFIDYGYANTTTPKIADCAKLSRGAMTHHFESRKDIILSAVAYLYRKRLTEYEEMIIEATRDVSAHSDVTVTRKGLERTVKALWKYFNLPSHHAHNELYIASRTDKELADVMEPLDRKYEKDIPEKIRNQFPVWKEMEDTRELLNDLIFFTLKGMSMSYMHRHKKKRVDNLLEHLVDDCMSVYKSSVRKARAAKL